MIRAELIHFREARVYLGRIAPAVQTKLRIFVADRVLVLRDAVKSNIARMFQSTGPLYRNVEASMEEAPGEFSGLVSIDGRVVKYAQIQERGGQTRAHDIRPVRAGALAFMAPGRMGFSGGPKQSNLVLAMVVHHPGSRIPEHPYARLALYRERPIFENGIREIVLETIDNG